MAKKETKKKYPKEFLSIAACFVLSATGMLISLLTNYPYVAIFFSLSVGVTLGIMIGLNSKTYKKD